MRGDNGRLRAVPSSRRRARHRLHLATAASAIAAPPKQKTHHLPAPERRPRHLRHPGQARWPARRDRFRLRSYGQTVELNGRQSLSPCHVRNGADARPHHELAQRDKITGAYNSQIFVDMGGNQLMWRNGPVRCTVRPAERAVANRP